MNTTAPVYAMAESDLLLSHAEKQYILRDLPQDEKPREKLGKYGPEALSAAELLAIVMGVGTTKEDVLHMAKRLLKEYGEQSVFRQKDPRKLKDALDIPLGKAYQLVACFELGRRFSKAPAGQPTYLRTARQVFEYAKDMRDLPKEHLRGIYLDNHYRVLHAEVISIGSLTANVIHPREVFRPALEYAASAVILVHNHPSGVATPSEADKEVTGQLVEAGRVLGINLLDHVIIARSKFMSVPADYN